MLLSRPTLPEGAAEWGVDVSFAQGDIDWAKAKADGVDFAILRLGYGAGGSDRRFVANVQGCKANGIKFGVYLYSYAWNASTATSEAEWTLTVLRNAGVSPSDLGLPVYYDLENQNPATPRASTPIFAGGTTTLPIASSTIGTAGLLNTTLPVITKATTRCGSIALPAPWTVFPAAWT